MVKWYEAKSNVGYKLAFIPANKNNELENGYTKGNVVLDTNVLCSS